MGLEVFTGWIKDLIATNPAGTDDRSQGDDHIRGVKATLKQQFSGLTQGKAVTVTEDQLNSIPTIASDTAAAKARADACLPKNGSEQMSGPLIATEVIAVRPSGESVCGAMVPGQSMQRFLLGAQAAYVGLPLYKVDGAFVGHALRADLDGAGIPTAVTLGFSGVPVSSAYVVPIDATGDVVASCGWVNDVRARQAYNLSGAQVDVTAEVLVLEVPAVRSPTGGAAIAHAQAQFEALGATIAASLRVDLVNSAGTTIASIERGQSIGAAMFGIVDVIVGFGGLAVGGGDTVYARVFAKCVGGTGRIKQYGASVALSVARP